MEKLAEIVYFGATGDVGYERPSVKYAGTKRRGFHGKGLYLGSFNTTRLYAFDEGQGGGRVFPLLVDIRNPIPNDVLEELKHRFGDGTEEAEELITAESIRLGYDGVVLRDAKGELLEAVAYDDNQVRSAARHLNIDNKGNVINN